MAVTIDGSNTPTAGGVIYGDGTEYVATSAGTSGQLLQSNGSSAPSWVAAPSTSPAGSTGQVQYNNAGAFGAVSSGTSGQVLTSAGTGAAPTWTTPSAGAMVLISTATASASASISFTGLTTTYAYYIIEYDSLYGSTTGSGLFMYVSSDNGSTYIGSGQYKTLNWLIDTASTAGVVVRDPTGNEFLIGASAFGMSNAVTSPSSGMIKIFAPASTACTFTWQTANRNSTILETQTGAGDLVTAVAVNAVKIQGSGVNITGNFRLYGVVKV